MSLLTKDSMEYDDKALGLDVAIGTIGFGLSNGGIDEFFECFSSKIEDTELDVLIASRFSLIRFATCFHIICVKLCPCRRRQFSTSALSASVCEQESSQAQN